MYMRIVGEHSKIYFLNIFKSILKFYGLKFLLYGEHIN